jgi:transcriptional regulator with XRE-family HTH domain
MDQSELANKVGLSKSTISRILSGTQEPKLGLANEIAKALGVTLDLLVEDSEEISETDRMVTVSEEEVTILKMARVIGVDEAMKRLMNAPTSLDARPPIETPIPLPFSLPQPGWK